MPWAAAVGAVGAIGGALISSSAASDAADSQARSSADAIAEQRRQADRGYADGAPYRAAGAQALGQLQAENGRMPTAAEVMSDPGYAFGQQQGQQALDRKAAAGGGRVSGASLKAASSYATDYATTGYGAAYQRRQDRLNRLASLAGIGQTATGASAAAGGASANAISGIIGSQGDARAAGQLAQGNIWSGAANQLGAIGQRWANQQGGGGYPGTGNYSSNPVNIDTGHSFTNSQNYG